MSKSKRMYQLECSWQQEAEAKAERFLRCKYSRAQRRWLPLIENFSQRQWMEAEKQRKRITPKAAIKVRRLDTNAWIERASQQLRKDMRQREEIKGEGERG